MPTEPNREETLFAAALRLPAGERDAFLGRECAGDAQLRQRVEALLQADEHAGQFLEAPPTGVSAETVVVTDVIARVTEQAGERIGRYKLLEKIGEGGFGDVWMAEQEEPVRRRVALKIIKLGMDTREVIARFEAERQALALMDHPHIAKVFDGGATESGRPYFVLELARGLPITEFSEKHKLSIPERLELFMQVCQAVQHAHQKGIIHRDLKPSNVLVTMQDDKPVPKVIDFGIAKAIEQKLTEKTLFTRFGQIIGTPAYMSPEQAGLGGLDIDTRSDIYSLGVLLYELLTGRTPFETKRLLEAGWEAILQTIREKEPPKPSTRLCTLTKEQLSEIAACRRTAPEKLGKLVRGELDWVVIKALEKDRARRYESANGLAMDLQRHLNHEPVVAASPSAAYRFRRFARRHRVALATVSAFVLVLCGGVVTSIWQAWRANRFALQAITQQHIATNEAARATQLFDQSEKAREEAEFNLYRNQLTAAIAAWIAGDVLEAEQTLEACPARFRHWEWHYLNRQCHEALLSFAAEPKPAPQSSETTTYGQLAVTLDGTKLCVVRPQSGTAIFDATEGQHLASIATNSTAGTFSPDGQWFVEAAKENTPARVLEVATGKTVARITGTERTTYPTLKIPGSGLQFENRNFTGALALSDDGRLVAVRTTKGVRVCAVPTAEIRAEFEFPESIATPVAFTSGGESVLIGYAAKHGSATLKLMRIADGVQLFSASRPRSREIVQRIADGGGEDDAVPVEMGSSRFRVCELARFDSNGELLALIQTAPREDQSILEVWDLRTSEMRFQRKFDLIPTQMAFVPSTELILVSGFVKDASGAKSDLLMVSSKSGEAIRAFRVDRGTIHPGRHFAFDGWSGYSEQDYIFGCLDVSLSANGKLAAVACLDRLVHVLDLDQMREGAVFHGHAAAVAKVAFHPDGKRVYSLDSSSAVKGWDLEGAIKPPSIAPVRRETAHVAASANVLVCESDTQRGRIGSGPLVMVVNFDQRTIRSWWMGRSIPGIGRLLSSDGATLATVEDGVVLLRDVETGQDKSRLAVSSCRLGTITLSPDGRWLAATCATGFVPDIELSIRVWNTENGIQLPPIARKPPDRRFHTFGRTPFGWGEFSFSPDGSRLAADHGKDDVRLYSISSAPAQAVELVRIRGNSPVLFSPDGQSLVVWQRGQGLALVASDTGRVLKSLGSDFDAWRWFIRFNADGTILVCQGLEDLVIWDLQTGTVQVGKASFWAPGAFSLGNRRVAAISSEGQLQVWDLQHAVPICALPIQSMFVAFSTDGQRLFSVDLDGVISVLDGSPWNPEVPSRPKPRFRTLEP